MLKIGRTVVQMQYEDCEMCGKSRLVSMDNTIGLVPSSKTIHTTDEIIHDTCRCKRRRSTPQSIDSNIKSNTQIKPTSQMPSPSIREKNGQIDSKYETNQQKDAHIGRRYAPKSLRIRLRRVEDGYEPILQVITPLKIQIHHHNGVYIAIPPTETRQRRFSNADSMDSDTYFSSPSAPSSPNSSPAPSAPSSPIRPPLFLPNGLNMNDLSLPPWTLMHPDAPNNRTQCEVCGKEGHLICCDRCPSVYHTDCLPRDHVITVDPWLCPSCLQTPFDHEKACRLCAGDTNLSQIILCDCCDDEYHLYCLNPPLTEVPEGDWFCPICQSQGHTRRQCLKKKRNASSQKALPQFTYTSLLAESYEDLTILDRGAWMRPPQLGKQWENDDIRKLTQAQSKARIYRDKVSGRVRRVTPSLTKMHSNVAFYEDRLSLQVRTRLVQLAYSTQLNAEFRVRLTMSERVQAFLQWRHAWATAPFEVDVFMRLLRVWHELEESIQETKFHLPSPPPRQHLKWSFSDSRSVSLPNQNLLDKSSERLQLGFERSERSKISDLDPFLLLKLEQLRITSPLSVRSILNPF